MSTPKVSEKSQALRGIIAKARRYDVLMSALGLTFLSFGILVLAALFIDMAITGYGRITPEFFTSFPSRRPDEAGILSSWVGPILVTTAT